MEDPFSSIPPSLYKRENFFPCITDEYRHCVRNALAIGNSSDSDSVSDSYCYSDNEEPPDEEEDIEPFDSEKPNYILIDQHPPVKKGDTLDVISLLSGGCQDGCLVRCVPTDQRNNLYDYVEVGLEDSLRDKKYVLLLCVFVPAKWCEISSRCLSQFSLLSSDLMSSHCRDFEMVIVAKMREDKTTGCDYDEDAFRQFFSAFPGRLAVPYSMVGIRDSVCATLGFSGSLESILVGPDHTIVQYDYSFIISYGAIAFPFTDDRLGTLAKEYSQQSSLVDLLGCCGNPSFCLRNFGSSETQSVEQLSKKLVGLYLFKQGDKLSVFHEVYHQCRERKLDNGFEIVIVCMPLHGSIHPNVFQDEVLSVLDKLDAELDVSSWWVFPYENSVCLRLWEMSSQYAWAVDAMIIVGPHGSFVDAAGGQMINNFGIDIYPFTREVIVQRYVKRAEDVTLESLLNDAPGTPLKSKIYASSTTIERGGEWLNVSDLIGKNVLLYIDFAPICEYTYNKLINWYPKIKEVDPDFELIVVLSKDSNFDHACLPEMWLVCRCEPEHFTYLLNDHGAFYGGYTGSRIRNGLGLCSVLAFGKNGHIHSLQALRLCDAYGYNSFPFNLDYKNLRLEIIWTMSDFEFMRNYEWIR